MGRILSGIFALSAIWALLLPGALRAQDNYLQPIRQLHDYRFGPDRSLLDAVDAVVHDAVAGKVDRERVAEALEQVAKDGTTFDGRQAACRRLILVAGTGQIDTMVQLLSDPLMTHWALMVLARIPGPAVSEALRSALPRLRGAALQGTLDLLGERKDSQAVPQLVELARSADPIIAATAFRALARIGGPRAQEVMMDIFTRASISQKKVLADAILLRAEVLAASGDRRTAMRFYQAVDRNGMPEAVRVASLRGQALLSPATSAPTLIKELRGSSAARRNMALTLLRELPGPTVTSALCEALTREPASVRVQLLHILAERADPAAAPHALQASQDQDTRVQVAAARALGGIGGKPAVSRLLTMASTGDPDVKAAAEHALLRVHGTGVDQEIWRATGAGSPEARAVALRTALARGISIPTTQLLNIARTERDSLQRAALDALKVIGGADTLEPLADFVARLSPEQRDGAAGAFVEIARRTNPEQATRVLRQRLDNPDRASDRVTLAEMLAQIGGAQALARLQELARESDTDVQVAAVRALGEWPDPAPMAALRSLLQQDVNPRVRALAMRGYARMLALPGNGVTQASAGEVFEEALSLAQTSQEKRMLLTAMAAVGSERVLRIILQLRPDSELRDEAEAALLAAAHLTAGAWPAETREAIGPLAADAADEKIRTGVSTLLRIMEQFGNFCMAWEVSPSYEQERRNFSELFDIPFPPEQTEQADQVPWKPMPVGQNPEQPWILDLLALHGGEQKVTYLRTAVWSPEEQYLVVEIGSDDGFKMWWNGVLCMANNTQRGVAPAQDRVEVVARSGWNRMLLKVTQNVMGWGACVRFVRKDGSPAVGLRFLLPSALSTE